MAYWVYILRSDSTGQYYVGHTGDLDDRVRRHNAGRVTVTRNRGPWQLVHSEEFPTRAAAATREQAIKRRKSRAYLSSLCESRHVG